MLAGLRLGVCGTALWAACGVAAREATFEGLDPLVWASAPRAPLSHTVVMTAEALGDDAEYRFECTVGGAESSAWQAAPTWRAINLRPATDYTFVAHVRRRGGGPALRAPSTAVSCRTPPANRFDAIVADEAELIPIAITGDKDNRLNVVIINRWRRGEGRPYNKPELRETFLRDVRDCIEPAFALGGPQEQSPFANYQAFYNVWALWWPSTPPWDPPAYDKGQSAVHWKVYNELVRDRLFLPWRREGRGWVTHLAWINSRGGGGGAGLLLDQRVGDALIEGNSIPPFFHEFSHTAMKLGDKYIGWGQWGRADESSNTTLVFQREHVKWRAWIDPDTPVPTPYNRANLRKIGLFEGGVHRISTLFRPTPVCSMGVNQFGDTLCALCKQQAVLSHYDYVDPIDSATPARGELVLATPGRARFAVRRVKPRPDTQQVAWRLNGRLVGEGVDEVEVELGALAEYELVCTLVDRTAMVREAPPFVRAPWAERRWRITNPRPTAPAAPLVVTLAAQPPGVWGVADGAVRATVSGGRPPYTYEWANGGRAAACTGLDAGEQAVTVVDSDFRRAVATCRLARPTGVKVDVRAAREAGGWRVTLDTGGAADVSARWDHGAQGLTLTGLADGRYGYVLTHRTGGERRGELALTTPAAPFAARVDQVVAATGENNGQIRLALSGGRPPYACAWADAPRETSAERWFLAPGEYRVVAKDANQTAVEHTVTVADAPSFALARPTFVADAAAVRIADPRPGLRYLWYAEDYPVYIPRAPRGVYEGTFTKPDGTVCEATGAVIANVDGWWANGRDVHAQHNREHNDFGSWVRLDAYLAGRHELPLTFRLQCDHRGRPGQALKIRGETKRGRGSHDIVGEATWTGTCDRGRLVATGTGPDGGRFDLRYTARHEQISRPLHVGAEFRPPRAGQYWVGAQRTDDGALSSNRVGVAVTMGARPSPVEPVAPDKVASSKPLFWLDAGDFDGDGTTDDPPFERGSVLGWRSKAPAGGGFGSGAFVLSLPNALNGRMVADWQYIWVEGLQHEVKGYQTVFMVYRDHELSEAGSGPWGGVPICLWDLRGTPALERVPAEFRQASVWRDGARVDPYATPAPLDWQQVTFELASPSQRAISRTHTKWEGAVAEFVAFDGKLSEAERRGVEEYLRRKWLSAVHLGGG